MSKLSFYESDTFVDYYDTLDIPFNSEQSEIKEAYHKLVKKHHPDQGGSDVLFRKVNEAYEILSNENTKNEYDAYYIRGDDNFANDELISLKSEFKNYVEQNNRELTQEEKDKLFLDVIQTVQSENKKIVDEQVLTEEDIKDRKDDLQRERNDALVEESDSTLYDLLEDINIGRPGNDRITVSDLYDFFKYKNNSKQNNQQLMASNFLTMSDINNPMTSNFNFIEDDLNNNNSEFHTFFNDQHSTSKNDLINFTKNIDNDEFFAWKDKKETEDEINNAPVTENDFEKLLARRKMEEQEINNEIENNLEKHKQAMSLVEGGDQFQNNLNFFSNFDDPFEKDYYSTVLKKSEEKFKSVNDVNNVGDGLNFNSNNILNDVDELKKFVKINKNDMSRKEKTINDTDLDKLMNDRKNIDDIIKNDSVDNKNNGDDFNFDYVMSKHEKSVNNVVKRDNNFSRKNNNSSQSKFKQMVESNAKESVEKKYGINLEKDRGNIEDYYFD